MAEVKEGITITVDVNTNKLQMKLRAIARHVTALADELDSIDNTDDELPTRPEGSE